MQHAFLHNERTNYRAARGLKRSASIISCFIHLVAVAVADVVAVAVVDVVAVTRVATLITFSITGVSCVGETEVTAA